VAMSWTSVLFPLTGEVDRLLSEVDVHLKQVG
jgi:hypothetical protein